MQKPSHSALNSSSISFVTDKLGLGVLIYAYAMLLGSAYIFGYWRVFGFDVFPYASSIDYISAPLDRLLILISAPLLFSLVLFSQSDHTDSELLKNLSAYLILLYSIAFGIAYYQAISRFIRSDFHYEDENSVLALAAALFFAGCCFTYRIFKHEKSALICSSALILMQLAGTVAAGYSDGKAIFNGAANTFFLENKNLCEPEGARDWVYLGKFSSRVFFMNTIDKRLCITVADSFSLTPRKFAEGL
ncbi:hypothetical protein [Pseudomonas saliphila]|uniref:hypothetical protein n=1 Tax=Pseudomonas saliphila TaxID=2586906 RepID=UPI0012386907|nr:hypothetical protein [Pseudomonas saliphila]